MFYIDIKGRLIITVAYRWLELISVCAVLNAIVLLFYDSHNFMLFAMLLPFFSTMLFDICFGIITLFNLPRIKQNDSIKYIEHHYRSIYEKMYPHFGRRSYDGMAYIRFIMGKYDDGSDKKLQSIKKDEKMKLKLLAWAHLLAPVVWGINILIIKLKQ